MQGIAGAHASDTASMPRLIQQSTVESPDAWLVRYLPASGVRMSQRRSRMRTMLAQHAVWILVSGLLSFILFQIVVAAFGRDGAPAAAACTLCFLCTSAIVLTFFLNMHPTVFRLLIRRPQYNPSLILRLRPACQFARKFNMYRQTIPSLVPADLFKAWLFKARFISWSFGSILCCRVIYFAGAVILSEALSITMKWAKSSRSGIVTVVLLDVSASAAFTAVPLFDGLHPSFAGRSIRFAATTVVALVKGYSLVHCKGFPLWCQKEFHDFAWKVSSGNSMSHNSSNVTSNGTAADEETHVVISTLDLRGSCDAIIMLLSLQVCGQPWHICMHDTPHAQLQLCRSF